MHGSEIVALLVGLVIGLIFAAVAILLESVAIGFAGFLGGGYVVLGIVELIGLHRGAASIVAFMIGGVVGVFLVIALLDWALITISSLAGASMTRKRPFVGRWSGGLGISSPRSSRRPDPRLRASP